MNFLLTLSYTIPYNALYLLWLYSCIESWNSHCTSPLLSQPFHLYLTLTLLYPLLLLSFHSLIILPSFSLCSILSFADSHTLNYQHPLAPSCIITLPFSHYCSLLHQVHQHMVGFSRQQLHSRWRLINPGVSKGLFTIEEDFIMIKVRTLLSSKTGTFTPPFIYYGEIIETSFEQFEKWRDCVLESMKQLGFLCLITSPPKHADNSHTGPAYVWAQLCQHSTLHPRKDSRAGEGSISPRHPARLHSPSLDQVNLSSHSLIYSCEYQYLFLSLYSE